MRTITFFIILLAFVSCKKEATSYENRCDTSPQTDSTGIPIYTICFPSAFTPDGDGVYDYFFTPGNAISINYSMEVFGRNNERIFFTNDPNKTWDGSMNHGGTVGPSGNYKYKVSFTDVAGSDHTYYGEVMLLK